MPKKALMVWGGWDGHTPKQSCDRFLPFLQQQGYEVVVKDSLAAYADADLMGSLDLIIQSWTMGKLEKEQWEGLDKAVSSGVGLAGWHGGLCDSFRGHCSYHWMTGGQFLSHPGNIKDYRVDITNWSDPITEGLKSFTIKSEQYYMLVDPANVVLATTTFDGVHHEQSQGVVMPTVWKKRWGKGRVFFSALGHVAADFDVPEARILMERGMLWASR